MCPRPLPDPSARSEPSGAVPPGPSGCVEVRVLPHQDTGPAAPASDQDLQTSPGGAGLDGEQSYPDLPPATIILLEAGRQGSGRADVCARALPPWDASLQTPRLLEACLQHRGRRGPPPLHCSPRSGVSGCAGASVAGRWRAPSAPAPLSLPSPSGCVQTTCGGCVSVRTACLCVRDRQQDQGSSRPG